MPATSPHAMTSATDRQRPNVTFFVLALAGTSYAFLQSLVAPALPDMQHALHTSENAVSWVLTAYLLSASVATPLIGRLGDIYGKERLLVIVLALLSVGTVVSALSSSIGPDARRAGAPGRCGRHLPARLRDHQRRVPARAGGAARSA